MIIVTTWDDGGRDFLSYEDEDSEHPTTYQDYDDTMYGSPESCISYRVLMSEHLVEILE